MSLHKKLKKITSKKDILENNYLPAEKGRADRNAELFLTMKKTNEFLYEIITTAIEILECKKTDKKCQVFGHKEAAISTLKMALDIRLKI